MRFRRSSIGLIVVSSLPAQEGIATVHYEAVHLMLITRRGEVEQEVPLPCPCEMMLSC